MRPLTLQISSFLFPGALALLGMAGGLAGCSNIEPVAPHEPVTDPAQLYMALTLDHPAVNLSTVPPYNTLQLTATPRDALGHPMLGLPAPTFTTPDTTKVDVTADGLLTAVGVTSQFSVIASLTFGLVTHADTAVINVTNMPDPPMLDTLSIQRVQPDSTVWPLSYGAGGYVFFLYNIENIRTAFGLGMSNRLTTRVRDTAGNAISGLSVDYRSLDPAVATLRRQGNPPILVPVFPGQARIVAQTTVYGVARADTLIATITLPVAAAVSINRGPTGTTIFQSIGNLGGVSSSDFVVTPDGIVHWFIDQVDSVDAVDVVFDDPTNVVMPPANLCAAMSAVFGPGSYCGAGDMLVEWNSVGPGSTKIRQFPVPGIYPFRSMRTGATGRIIVTDDPNYKVPSP